MKRSPLFKENSLLLKTWPLSLLPSLHQPIDWSCGYMCCYWSNCQPTTNTQLEA